jgi:hypothetical protein
MSKAKRQAAQDARAIKQTMDIITGRVKIVCYEKTKRPTQPNRKGGGVADKDEREEMAGIYTRLLLLILPGILAMFKDIPDPRNVARTKHPLPLVMLFGIIMFLTHSTSRRAANREIADDSLLDVVGLFLPSAKSMPHADTLARLLSGIDAACLEGHYCELIKSFISSDQFKELNPGRLVVACDGTQKFTRSYEWDNRALNQNVGVEGKERHYVYLLESVLIMENGMTLPLLTEFLENHDVSGDEYLGKSAEAFKQDCETKAFHRLAQRLVKLLGKGVVTVLLDGIYANGPVISRCSQYGWEFMITLKRGSLTTVWQDFDGLRKIELGNELAAVAGEGGRTQLYQWSNNLEYIYGNNHKKLKLNICTCTETWVEEHPRSGGKPETKVTNYAWLSSSAIDSKNVIRLCRLGRSRWRIETGFLVAKHHGYNYSHCYSYDWDTMIGFHTLMKYGIFLNILLIHSEALGSFVRPHGNRGFIKKVWEVLRSCGFIEYTQNDVSLDHSRSRRRKLIFPALAA